MRVSNRSPHPCQVPEPYKALYLTAQPIKPLIKGPCTWKLSKGFWALADVPVEGLGLGGLGLGFGLRIEGLGLTVKGLV